MNIQALSAAIMAVCPIVGVDSDGVISFVPSATASQRAAAQQVVAGWSDPAPVPSVTVRQLVAQVKAAGIGSALLTFLAAASTISSMPTSVSYWNAIALNTAVPIDNTKMANVLAGAGVTDVPAFMAAALLLPA